MRIVQDLIFTRNFLVLGTVEGKISRLQEALERQSGLYLTVSDAMLRSHRTPKRVVVPRIHLSMSEILFAHEYVDSGGDVFLKAIAQGEDRRLVKILLGGFPAIEIEGRVREKAYEKNRYPGRFFVIEKPKVTGIPEPDPFGEKTSPYHDMGYVLVAKEHVACVLDYAHAPAPAGPRT